MKKKVLCIFLFIIIFVLNNTISATSGALKKDSIKTCPDGITYGYHGKNEHWHVAEKSNTKSGWSAIGEPLNSDPCPNNTTNNKLPNSNNNNSNNENVKETKQNNNSANQEEVKSNDTSIKTININDKIINDIKDEIIYEVDSKSISLLIELNDPKSSYEIIGNREKLNANEYNSFEIIVTAENGTSKKYYLKIFRKAGKSNIKINCLLINNTNVESESDNKYLTNELFWNDRIKIEYELNEDNSTFIIYKDNYQIDDLNNIKLTKGDNNFIIKIIDKNDNEKYYELTVKRMSLISSIMAITFVLCLTSGLIIIMTKIFKKKRDK